MLLMGRILGASWACENLDLGVLPDCHAEGRSMSMVANSYICTIRSEDKGPALLTVLLKIVCKVHTEGTLAVTGQAGVLTLSADAGFCRDSGKLEDAFECTRNTTLDYIAYGTVLRYNNTLSCGYGYASVSNCETVGLLYTAHHHVQHSPLHDSIIVRSSEAAVCPRRANAEGHPSPHQRSWIYL